MAGTDTAGFVPLAELTVRRERPPLAVRVQSVYSGLAKSGSSSLCCSPDDVYDAADLEGIPEEVRALSSSCGAPLNAVDVAAGETVADFGCGAGLDVIVAARRVGPTGKVIGIDGSLDMVKTARRAAADLGLAQIEIRAGDIRRPPLRDDSVDVLLSNCVLSMFPDKEAILGEIVRVLRPGGRAVISDAVLDDGAEAAAPGAQADDWERCVVGLTRDQYRDLILSAGFTDVDFRNEQPVTFRDGAPVRSVTVVATAGGQLEPRGCC